MPPVRKQGWRSQSLRRVHALARLTLASLVHRWEQLEPGHAEEEALFRAIVIVRLVAGHLDDNLPR